MAESIRVNNEEDDPDHLDIAFINSTVQEKKHHLSHRCQTAQKDRPKGFEDRTERKSTHQAELCKEAQGDLSGSTLQKSSEEQIKSKKSGPQVKDHLGMALARAQTKSAKGKQICRKDRLVRTVSLTRAQIDRQGLFAARASYQMYRQREGTQEIRIRQQVLGHSFQDEHHPRGFWIIKKCI